MSKDVGLLGAHCSTVVMGGVAEKEGLVIVFRMWGGGTEGGGGEVVGSRGGEEGGGGGGGVAGKGWGEDAEVLGRKRSL